MPDPDVLACLIDRENNLWFGSRWQGLFKLLDRNIYSFPLPELVKSVTNHGGVVDERGHLYVASGVGILEIWKNWHGFWQ
ncbi:MAG: hypothetical protein ACE5NG_20540 [bacterium]